MHKLRDASCCIEVYDEMAALGGSEKRIKCCISESDGDCPKESNRYVFDLDCFQEGGEP
ncbi:hypothetical protein [Candidatus Pyrohabitans sp.]